MDQKICLDTSICIEIIKGNQSFKSIFDKLGSYDVFITSIAVFELFLRETNIKSVEEFVDNFYILNLDNLSAIKGSNIFKQLKKQGKIIDIRDIFVAAICIINGCSLLTLNKKHFEE